MRFMFNSSNDLAGQNQKPGPSCRSLLVFYVHFLQPDQSLLAIDFKSTDLLTVHATLVPTESPADARFFAIWPARTIYFCPECPERDTGCGPITPIHEPWTLQPLESLGDFATGDDSPSLSAIASATADPRGEGRGEGEQVPAMPDQRPFALIQGFNGRIFYSGNSLPPPAFPGRP
jgi:hypothetical protein